MTRRQSQRLRCRFWRFFQQGFGDAQGNSAVRLKVKLPNEVVKVHSFPAETTVDDLYDWIFASTEDGQNRAFLVRGANAIAVPKSKILLAEAGIQEGDMISAAYMN